MSLIAEWWMIWVATAALKHTTGTVLDAKESCRPSFPFSETPLPSSSYAEEEDR